MSLNDETPPSSEPTKKSRETEKPRRPGSDPRSNPRPRGFFLLGVLLAVVLFVAAISKDALQSLGVERNFYKARDLILADSIDPDSLELAEDTRTLTARLKSPQGETSGILLEFATENEIDRFRKEAIEVFNEKFPERKIDWRTTKTNGLLWQLLLASLPWILILLFLYFFFFRQLRAPGAGGNVLTFGRSRARVTRRESTGITFADVAGINEAKDEVLEIIEFLKNPKRFQKLGCRMPRGVMLVGSPGTGKTLLAKAIAGEADVPFFSICGSDFVEMFVGVGAARVRDLFRQARESSPCIVFLDEVDAVGRKRGSGMGGGHDEREQTLNAILVEMDGFTSDEGIIFLAATNRPDVLDPALLRPGRFDREIVLDLPDLKGREEILRVHSRKIKLDATVDIHRIARGTASFSGAELAALVNEAAIVATMQNQESVKEGDLEEARDKIRWGRQKTSRTMTDRDRRIIAYHEAGHAVAAHLLPDAEPVHKVTIVPRGMALGSTMQLPENDSLHLGRKSCLASLQVLYAGRIAEEIFCDDITAGASNDIERATTLARRMVTEWGMSEKLGPVHYSEGEESPFLGREPIRSREHSDTIALRIDEEVRRVLDESYASSQTLIKSRRAAVQLIAEALLLKETLGGDDIQAIINGEGALGPGELASELPKS